MEKLPTLERAIEEKLEADLTKHLGTLTFLINGEAPIKGEGGNFFKIQ